MQPSNRWWELFCDFRGFEEPAGTTPTFQSGTPASAETPAEEEEEESEETEPTETTDASGLKSALAKERAERKKLDRQLKGLLREKEDREATEGTELEKATKKAELAEQRTAKLAERFKESAVTTAILEAARALKFRDATDALTTDIRSAIQFEQDKEDPADIDIDETSVKTAVKKLATAKPYLLIGEGSEEPSGSKFGGKPGDKSGLSEEELKKKYPALNAI